MATLKVDLTNVDDMLAIEPGIYSAKVFEVKETESKKGKPMLAFVFRVDGTEAEGRKLFRNYTLTQEALWALKQTLGALGFGKDELSGEIELDLESLVGMPCRLNVKNREYEGTMRNDVRSVLAPSDEAETLGDLMTA